MLVPIVLLSMEFRIPTLPVIIILITTPPNFVTTTTPTIFSPLLAAVYITVYVVPTVYVLCVSRNN